MIGAQVGQRYAAVQLGRVAAELFRKQLLQFFKRHSVCPLSLAVRAPGRRARAGPVRDPPARRAWEFFLL